MKNIPFYCDIICFLFILYITLNHYIHPPVEATSLFPLWGICGLYFLCRWIFSLMPSLQSWVSLLLIIIGLYQVLLGFRDMHNPNLSSDFFFTILGSFPNPIFYASFLTFLFPMGIHMIYHSSLPNNVLRISARVTSFAYILGVMSMLPLCLNQSCLMACLAGISVVLFKIYRIEGLTKEITGEKYYKIVMWPIIGVTIIVLFITGIYNMKQDRKDGRLLIWKITTGIISEHPLTGVGFNNFIGKYEKAQVAYFAEADKTNEDVRNEIHISKSPNSTSNEYLRIAVENGIPSLLLFLTMLLLVLFYLYKNQELGLLGSVIAFLVFSFLCDPLSIEYISIYFVVLIALSLVDPQAKENPKWQVHAPLIFLLLLVYPILQSKEVSQVKHQALIEWQKYQQE